MATNSPSPLPCSLVSSLTNSAERCKFVVDNDCLEEDSVVDYVYLVYCEFGDQFHYASALLICVLAILFLALSSVADEFLCPSLLTVAKNLRMSDSLAGVTLLAFGNGCPDIFSSLAAASGDRSELIVGELLGAGIFCTSIVGGLVFIRADFKPACRPLLRDATFYLSAVYLIWLYSYNQQITFYGSLAFILIYVIYLIVALSGQAIHSRLVGNYEISNTEAKNESDVTDNTENWFKWREESLRRAEKKVVEGGTKTTLALDRTGKCLASTEHVSVEHQVYSTTKQTTRPNSGSHLVGMRELERLEKIACVKDEMSANLLIDWQDWEDFVAQVNPIDALTWRRSGVLGRVFTIARAPLLLAATLTVPVVDAEKVNSNWCRLLHAVHCLTVPQAVLVATGLADDFRLLGCSLAVLLLAPSAILALLLLKNSNSRQAPSYQWMLAYIGFGMSIVWIYLLAGEVIGLLKTVGVMFGMSDTAIGLGVLAWGNSLGDLVANLSLADAGYPRMALGASIGAPLLNLLLGFGLSFSFNLKPGEFAAIQYSSTVSLLCLTLVIVLLTLMLTTLLPADKSRRPFGFLLIGVYVVYLSTAFALEYQLIKL